ncbi:MAG: hypothetical protein ACHQ15_07405 [Candidatus Limnocylindrales bacterium]
MSQDAAHPLTDAHGQAAAGHEAHGMAGEGGHGDDHHDPHQDPSLGPIDWMAWGAAVLGVGIAAFVALLMALVVHLF